MSFSMLRRVYSPKSHSFLLKMNKKSLMMVSHAFQVSQHSNIIYPLIRSHQFSMFTPTTRRKKVEPIEAEPDWDFQEEARKCVKKVSVALEPVVELNEGFKLSVSAEELVLDVGIRGKVVLKMDMTKECLTLSTPTSGVFEYVYDVETQQWLGRTDRHDMRGMITRDLLRHFKGMPNF